MISIITATYNRSHFITDLLASVKRQTYKDWECLIIDDGSTDDTSNVIQPFLKGDKRFKYFQRPETYNKGLPGCRNYGLDIARGNFVIFFDDDDIAHPENLSICQKELERVDIGYCRYLREVFTGEFSGKFTFNSNYNKWRLGIKDLPFIVTGKIPFNSCQIMWRKECFDQIRFNENLMYAEDWECYTRILSEGVTGITVNKVLFFGRKHPASNTGEFWDNDPVRRKSKIEATKLVINKLSEEGLLSPVLIQFFIREGLVLKEYSILKKVLNCSDMRPINRLKYNLGFRIYPLLRPFFKWKGKLKN